MSYARYLSIAAQALRDDVLPTITSDAARDQLINSLRIIASVAMSLENSPADANGAASNALLPVDLRDAFARIAAVSDPAENIVVSADTKAGIAGGAHWLATTPWLDDPGQLKIARELLAWEGQLRRQRHQRLREAEISVSAASAQASADDQIETTLLYYLRQKLGNDHLQIREFRKLPGGRARLTVLIALEGHGAWPEWVVLQRDPLAKIHKWPGAATQFRLLSYVHQAGVRAPKPLLVELDKSHLGAAFIICERMPGAPPNSMNFFAPPPPSEKFALSLAEQAGKFHALAPEPLADLLSTTLEPGIDWAADLEQLIEDWNKLSHGPSLAMSAVFAWMRRQVGDIQPRRSLVHGDMMQHNMLVQDNEVSALLDWESGRIGHPAEDIGYVRPLVEQLVSWDRFMEVYCANGGPRLTQQEVDYFSFRSYIWVMQAMMYARGLFEDGTMGDIRMGEIGASLIPQFLNRIASSFDQVLQREAAADG